MQEPNPLAIFLLCVGGAAALIFVLWLNHRLRMPKQAQEATHAGALATMISYLFGGVGVNNYEDSDADFMSRAQDNVPANPPSSLGDGRETDARQTPIVLPERKIRAEELLTLFALMRRYNIPRDAAAAAFKAVNLPFNNNVWADAAPDDEMSVTPIAGRPTPAKFHDDPELEYQPLR